MQTLKLCAIVSIATLFFCGCGSSGPSPAEGDSLTGPWDIVLLQAATGKRTGTPIRQHNQIIALALSGDEQAVVTSCRKALPGPQAKQQANKNDKVDPTRVAVLRVWNAETGEVLAEREDPDTLHSVVWAAPRGKQFLSATIDYPAKHFLAKHRFVSWDYASGDIKKVARFELAPRSNVTVAFSGDGKSVVMCGDMHDSELDKENISREDLKTSKAIWAVRKWKIGGGKPIATKQVGLGITATRDVEQMVARANISADGSRMITWWPSSNRKPDPAYQLWDLQTFDRLGEPVTLQKGHAPIFLNFDGTRVFTTSRIPGEKNLSSYQVVEAESGNPIGPPVSNLPAMQAAFAGDGKSILTQTHQELDLWHLRMFNANGQETWKSQAFHNPRFIASVTRRNNRIAYAVFPPQASRGKE